MEKFEIVLAKTDIYFVLYHLNDLAVKQGLKRHQEFYPQNEFPRVSHDFIVRNNQLVIEDVLDKSIPKSMKANVEHTHVVIISAHPLDLDSVQVNIDYLSSYFYLAKIFIDDLRKKFTLQHELESNDGQRRVRAGRPHWPEDIWAWEQVHIYKRPLNQVYSEWIKKIGSNRKKRGELQDPIRQFARITNKSWRTK